MLKASVYRHPRTTPLFLAAGSVPPVAALVYVLATSGLRTIETPDALGLGLLTVAFEACFRWMGLGHLLVAGDLPRFLTKSVQAIAAGLGITWPAFAAFPQLSPGYGGTALVGLCAGGLLLAQRSLLPVIARARAANDDVLVVGREDLVIKLGTELFAGETARDATSLDGTPPWTLGLTLDPARLRTVLKERSIRKIIVAEPDVASRRETMDALLECRMLGVEVEDAVETYQRLHGKLWLEALDPARLVFAKGFRITPSYLLFKRVFDLACALALLIVAAPLMLLIAIVIKLESRGPVLFRQVRVGQFGKIFTLDKFRSMREDAEKETGPTWARKNDDRVTRVGSFLRRSHLDELPQVMNVLRGDLSFVGPRPERPCFVEVLRQQIPYYDLRHFVNPGITGWAQVRYRYADSVEGSYEKLQYDLAYARNASPWLDLQILVRTAGVVFAGGGR